MKIIEIDEELYQYIAAQTRSIGESASDILRRLLNLSSSPFSNSPADIPITSTAMEKAVDVKSPLNSTTKSAVENTAVLENQAKASSGGTTDGAAEPSIKITTKKQSEAAIQQTVNKVRRLLQSQDFQQENKAVVRFLSILTVLYRTNPESFAQATEQETSQGRTRTYFARDEATLLAAGNHTKPKQIPDTPYWVITNTNSARKMLMLERAMQFMHLPEDLIDEIRSYFSVN